MNGFLWLKKPELWIASKAFFKIQFQSLCIYLYRYIDISFYCLRKNRECWFFFGVSIVICGASRWSWSFKWENANAAQGTCVGFVFHMGKGRDELQKGNKSNWAIAKICSHDLRISLEQIPLKLPLWFVNQQLPCFLGDIITTNKSVESPGRSEGSGLYFQGFFFFLFSGVCEGFRLHFLESEKSALGFVWPTSLLFSQCAPDLF